jgi:hypothetical protein
VAPGMSEKLAKKGGSLDGNYVGSSDFRFKVIINHYF